MARMKKPSVFVLDVDGVLTDGKYYYTAEGKVMKRFGPRPKSTPNVSHDIHVMTNNVYPE